MTSRIDFNRDWQFCKSSAEWPEDLMAEDNSMSEVILPHTWNADDMVVGDEHSPYVGAAWYMKRFRSPALADGQRLLVEFEAVAMVSKVWVNGMYVGGRNGGFLGFRLDATEALQPDGENVILVRADNRHAVTAVAPRNLDWNRYGGIHRPVWLHVQNHAFLDYHGVRIRTPEVTGERATVAITTTMQETALDGTDVTVQHLLLDPDGATVCNVETDMKLCYCRTGTHTVSLPAVAAPRLWSVDEPTLYTVKTQLLEGGRVLDSAENRIGFRYYRFDNNDGFVLNGKPVNASGRQHPYLFPGAGLGPPGAVLRRGYEADEGYGL